MEIKSYLYVLAGIAMYLFLGMLLGSCGNSIQAKPQNEGVESSKDEETFWDDYDFNNIALIHQPDITEQKFANFCVSLSRMSEPERNRQVDTLLTRSLRGSRDMFANFMTLAEKYLYDPNSPYRDGELYLPFLQWTIRSTQIEDIWKERPRYQLKLVLENRVGTRAHDFHYITNGKGSNDNTNGNAKGRGTIVKRKGIVAKGTLYSIKSEYTLIYFNNPECHDCGRVHGYLVASKVFTTMLQSGRLKLLALYPDEDLGSWTRHKEEYPSSWIAARYAKKADRETYHLPAIPSLYLLDKNKKVLLKDAPVEAVEEYLRKSAKSAGDLKR